MKGVLEFKGRRRVIGENRSLDHKGGRGSFFLFIISQYDRLDQSVFYGDTHRADQIGQIFREGDPALEPIALLARPALFWASLSLYCLLSDRYKASSFSTLSLAREKQTFWIK